MSETKLQRLYKEQHQSPWLDNLKRGYITSGELKQRVEGGIRGITSNPTIFAKAIEGADDYDAQFRSLVQQRTSVDVAYWDMVIDDIGEALRILRPVHDGSGGEDGFVSIDRFGASAPGKIVLEKLGYTGENVAVQARALVARKEGISP